MKEIKHILCPVDFSVISEKTVEAAGKLALRFGAKFTLMHVVSVIPASYGALYGIDFQSVDTMELIRSATEALEEVRKKQLPVNLDCNIVAVTGNVSSEIMEEVKKSSVDLIIMATSGAHGVEEFLIGSNAAKIARTSPCAVLTVSDPDSIQSLNKVLIPLDVSLGLGSLRAYLSSFRQLENFSAELLIINEPGYKDPYPEATRTFIEKEMELLKAEGVENISWKELISEDIVETICEYAKEQNFGLILMKSEGRSTFAKFILGSTTEGVINHSHIPVLSLGSRGSRQKGRFSDSLDSSVEKP